MDYLRTLASFELFSELLTSAIWCDKLIADWDAATTKEECELAEENYYQAQEHWHILMNEVKVRNLQAGYEEFCKFVNSKGWI